MKRNQELKFTIPSKGKFMEDSYQLLRDVGVRFEFRGRQLSTQAVFEDRPFALGLMRPKDIVRLVADGKIDMGIAGTDTIREAELGFPRGSNRLLVQTLLKLGIGKSALVFAAAENSNNLTLRQLKNPFEFLKQFDGKTIATSYPGLVDEYFEDAVSWASWNRWDNSDTYIQRDYLTLGGSVEIAPGPFGLADLIADLTETGTTLTDNTLRILGRIGSFQGALITNCQNQKGDNELLDLLYSRIYQLSLARRNPDALRRQEGYNKLVRQVELYR